MTESAFIHGDTVCTECGDDAEMHELKRARDLIRARRQEEVSEAGWMAVEIALAYATDEYTKGGAGVVLHPY